MTIDTILDYVTSVLALILTPEGIGLAALFFFVGMVVDYAIRH